MSQAAGKELLGAAEVAELLGISKAALWERRKGRTARAGYLPAFPLPLAELACGPIWERAQIEHYLEELTRPPAPLAGLTAEEIAELDRRYGPRVTSRPANSEQR